MYDGMIATAASKTSSNICAVINTVISNLHLYRRHVYLNSYFSYILVVSDFQSRLGNLFYLRFVSFRISVSNGYKVAYSQYGLLILFSPLHRSVIQTFEQLSQHSNWLRVARPRRGGSIPDCCQKLVFSAATGPALKAINRPVKCAPTAVSLGLSGRCETVLIHSCSAKLRMSGAIPPFMAGIKLSQSMGLFRGITIQGEPEKAACTSDLS